MKISLHRSSVYIENRIDNGISSINIVTSSVGIGDSEIPSSHNSDWIQDSWATSSAAAYTQEDQEISLWTRKKVKALELNIHLKMLEDRKAIVNNVLEIALNMLDNTPMINR